MANFLDYIEWRGDVDFKTSPFNEVDALILCQIEYNNIDNLVPSAFTKKGITLRELSYRFRTAPDFYTRSDVGAMINPLTVNILQAAGESVRFGSLRLCGYTNIVDTAKDEQFSAVTYILSDKTFFIAYRGTDDTIVGWKEDCDLGWKDKVPAQVDALSYLEKAARMLKGGIMIGGHSKGGNLAIYASANAGAKVKSRIISVFNNDGPGFSDDFFKSEKFRSISKKVYTFVPQLSIVGMLFSHADEYITVESDEKGLRQHDPFSWHVSAHHFVEKADRDEQSKIIGETVNGWFSELSNENKELFVSTVFGVLKDTNATTNSELTANWWESIQRILKAMKELDPKTRDVVFKTLQLLFKCAKDTVLQEKEKEAKTKKEDLGVIKNEVKKLVLKNTK